MVLRRSPLRRERGLLWVQLAPLVATAEVATLAEDAPPWATLVPLGAAALFALAGLLLEPRPGTARALAVLALLASLAPLAPLAPARPELVLIACCGLWVLGPLVLSEPTGGGSHLHGGPARTARRASGLAIAMWFVHVLVLEAGPNESTLLGAVALLVAIALGVRWAVVGVAPRRGRRVVGLAAGVALVAAVLLRERAALALTALAVVPATVLVVVRSESDEAGLLDRILEHPARLLVATFFAISLAGAVMLSLPSASASGASIGLLDAAFTSISAVCVTGLIVLDTPHAFSAIGQGMLVLLIQIGGLGIMTFYTVAFAGLGRRLSLRHERAVAGAVGVEDLRHLVGSLRRVLVVTATSELLGALLLFGAFVYEGDDWARASWRAAFTSVSAFCNAGFALQTDSLIPYADNPVILHTVGALIVVGGLSPLAVAAVPRWLTGGPVALQARLILVTSTLLLLTGALAFGLLEWSRSLEALSWADRVHNSIFQSITLRTAGFNSVDLAVTRPATQTMMIVMMFVGGSPGGTAGGIKTTTAAVIALMVEATLRGRSHTEAAGRRIGARTIYKAAAVITVGVLAGLSALLAVQLTQSIELDVALFEVVSALGTVGLSIGGTGMLDSVGKIIIMACMFAGRVGPLTLFLFLTDQQHPAPIGRPETEVEVG